LCLYLRILVLLLLKYKLSFSKKIEIIGAVGGLDFNENHPGLCKPNGDLPVGEGTVGDSVICGIHGITFILNPVKGLVGKDDNTGDA